MQNKKTLQDSASRRKIPHNSRKTEKEKEKLKVRVPKYCPKIRDVVELTLKDVTETELTFKGKVAACSMESRCFAWNDDGFCWLHHEIETGKVGAEKIE